MIRSKNLANYFTCIRLLMSPIFLFIYVEHQTIGIPLTYLPFVLLVLFAIAELSDALDGHLARRYNQVTEFGKLLDPMADSIYRISIFLAFTLPPINLHLLFVFLFLYRDSMISTLRTVCALRGFALGARRSGKIKAIIQAISTFIVITMLIPYSLNTISQHTLHITATVVVAIAAIYSLISGIEYLIVNRADLKKVLQQPRK